MSSLPLQFLERLKLILPDELQGEALKTFSRPSPVSVRINTLKVKRSELLERLAEKKIDFTPVPWYQDALVLGHISRKDLGELDLLKNGLIYGQGLSSLLPVLVLDPKPGEKILDMCAAPGSKTTQMAAHMQNLGSILALESVKDRFYKLKSVVASLGAANITLRIMDSRRFRFQGEYFDKILVDAPCSSEGRFKTAEPKTIGYWSPRKIREMVQKQRGLLMTASHLLKPGGVLVYSTCTFAPEENEGVIDWLLKRTKSKLQLSAFTIPGIKVYPPIRTWKGKAFNPQVERCFRALPDGTMEGFFIAKIIRELA